MLDVQATDKTIALAQNINVHYNVHPRHVALILAYYDGDSRTIDELESLTKLPRWQVKNIAARAGYRARREQRFWTSDEKDFLLDRYGLIPLDSIARKLKRSEASISGMAFIMQLDQLANQGNFSLSELAGLLGVCRETIRVNWIRLGLTYHRIRKDRAYLFYHNEIRIFFNNHPEVYNWPKLSERKLMLLGLKNQRRFMLAAPPLDKKIECNYYLRGREALCGYTEWMDLYEGQQICPECGRKMSSRAVAYRGQRNLCPRYESGNASIAYYFEGGN